MNTIRTFFSAVLISFFALVSATSAQTITTHSITDLAQMPNEKDFTVGQTWSWQRVDGLTGLKQEGVTRQVVLNKVGVKSFHNGKITYKVTSPFQKGSDDKPWISWPLFVGKTWKYENLWSYSSGSGKTSQDVEVLGVEEVVVPAGKFMAYKLVYSGFWSSTSGSGSGRQENVVWYSNEIKAVVKSSHNDVQNRYSEELVKYTKE